jgi:membrane protein DedA with SNARE-associated domain
LFFVFLPVDFLPFLYMFAGFKPEYIFLISVLTAFLAHIVNYWCGYLTSKKIIDRLIGRDKYEKAQGTINKFGGYAIVIFNAFPLPSSILVLAAGMMRYSFRKAMFWSVIGLLIKYSIFVLGYTLIR